MSQSIQSDKVTANISGNVSSTSMVTRTFLVLEQGAGEDTTVSTNYASPSDTSTLGFWETSNLALPTGYNTIAVSSTAQYGRIAFPAACTVFGRSLAVMFNPSSAVGTITFTVNRIATDGTRTAIGNKTVDNTPSTLQPLNLSITANTAFTAGEALELAITHGTSINLTQLYFCFAQY